MTGMSVASATPTHRHLSPPTASSLEASRSPAESAPTPAPDDQTTMAQSESPTHASLDQSGNLRFGNYELIEEIGRGGMGIIYRARQVGLNRFVALKVILTGPAATDADVQRFRAEAEIAAGLDHPHIVPIYEVGNQNGWHYYSMRLIDGVSLAHRLGEFVHDHRSAARLVERIARAVQHAHEHGIVHRDLKPGNILLDSRGEPHLTDFGLAASADGRGITVSRMPPSEPPAAGGEFILGTPSYMAPEQATGQVLNSGPFLPAVDIHSLGAILYQLICGRVPYRGETLVETLLKTVHNEAPPPSRYHRVDTELEAICLVCLRKQPGERYPSARALADDLERWQAGKSTWASRRLRQLGAGQTRESAAKPPVQARRRLRGLLASAAITIAAALVVAWLIRYWTDSPASQRKLPLGGDDLPSEPSPGANHSSSGRSDAWPWLADTAAQISLFGKACRSIQDFLAAESERHMRYAGLVRDAAEALDAGGHEWARACLAECPKHLRGWEWQHLSAKASGWWAGFAGSTKPGPGVEISAAASCLSISPDAAFAYWAEPGGTIIAWNLSQRKSAWKRSPRLGIVWAIAVHPDGHRLAVVGAEGAAILDAADGQWLVELRGHRGAIYEVVYSPDGKRIATTGQDRTIRIWDARTAKPVALCGAYAAVPRSLCFRPDSSQLAFAVGREIVVLDGHGGWELERTESSDGNVDCLAYSPDGGMLASAANRFITLHHARRLRPLQRIDADTAWVREMVLAPDGQRLFAAGAERIMVIDLKLSRPLLALEPGMGRTVTLHFERQRQTLRAAFVGREQTRLVEWTAPP